VGGGPSSSTDHEVRGQHRFRLKLIVRNPNPKKGVFPGEEKCLYSSAEAWVQLGQARVIFKSFGWAVVNNEGNDTPDPHGCQGGCRDSLSDHMGVGSLKTKRKKDPPR